MKRKVWIGIAIIAAICLTIECLVVPPVWRGVKYKSLRRLIESGQEDAAIAEVQKLSRHPLFNPDWTIQDAIPQWRWAHSLDMWLFGCPTCRASGTPLLAIAARQNQDRLVEALLRSGASIKADGAGGTQSLGGAAYAGNTNLVARFIALGADVNWTNTYSSILHGLAAYSRKPEVMSMLIEAGADVNATNFNGDMPLDFALKFTNHVAIAVLTERGASSRTNRGKM